MFRFQYHSIIKLIRDANAKMIAYMLNPRNRIYAILIAIFMLGNLFQALNRAVFIDAADLNGFIDPAIAAKFLDEDPFIMAPNNSYSAFFYVVMSILSPFARWFASLLWGVANIAFYLWSIVVINDILLKTQPDRKKLNYFIAPILTAPIFAINVHMGQTNMIVLLCVLVSMFYLYLNKHLKSALFLAFAIAYKTTPLIFIFFLLLKRKLRTAAYTIVFSLLFLIVIPMFFYTPQKSIHFFRSWSEMVIEPFFTGQKVKSTNTGYYHTNQSLDAFLNRHFTPYGVEHYGRAHNITDFPVLTELEALTAGKVIKLIILALLAFIAIRSGHIHTRLFPFEFSLFFIAILFISPSSWTNHYILALPAYVVVVNEILILPRGTGGRKLLIWFLSAGTGIMLLGVGRYLQSFSFYFLGITLFFIGLVIYTLFFAGKVRANQLPAS